MTTKAMKTHTIGVNTFAVFHKEEKGGVWMLQFIWGKKDFRIYLSRKSGGTDAGHGGPVLYSESQGEVVVSKLQYLYAFEWYDYQKVSGHGLAYEETCWQLGKARRYVELPKGFYDIAVELACREFGLSRHPVEKAG